MIPQASRQLLLDLRPEQAPTLENFVPGERNAELIARLRSLAAPTGFDAVYVWGAPGSGRSHLLAATARLAAAKRPCRHLQAAQVGAELAVAPGSLVVIDDVDRLDEAAQIALFRTFNAARLAALALLLAGSRAPVDLALREDLRSRIGQCLVYEVKPLGDDEKAVALRRHAMSRGMGIDDALVAYLLRHSRRDLPTLMAVLDALDRSSLERQRPVTVPLLREILQASFELHGSDGPRPL